MIKDHEEVVIFHTMAKQVDELTDNFASFESFKTEVLGTMKSLFGVTNELKQELFLLRNSRAESKHRDKPNATPEATSPPLQPETPSMPSEATAKSTPASASASATKLKGSSGPPSSNEPKVERKNKESNRKTNIKPECV